MFSSFSRPTERKPKRERGVLHRDESNLIALRDASPRGAKVSVSVSRRASSSFVVVVLVVERPPIRSNDGCLCRQHLLRARTSDAYFSRRSRLVAKRASHLFIHRRTQTNKRTKRERES